MKNMKQSVRGMLRSVGFDIRRCVPSDRGIDPFYDMRHFLKGVPSPLILDVGANIGQSVDRFKYAFPDSFVHSFEPSPATYTALEQHCNRIGGVKAWNCGVGSSTGVLPLLENSESDMSSFLAPGTYCWGEVTKTTTVEVVTLDMFAQEQNLGFIHVLKSDTQGFDFEVFKGAEKLMNENRIGLIYFELIVSDQYEGLPRFTEVLSFLLQHNFHLVAFYEPFFQDNLLSWTDALFVNADYRRRTDGVSAEALAKARD